MVVCRHLLAKREGEGGSPEAGVGGWVGGAVPGRRAILHLRVKGALGRLLGEGGTPGCKPLPM